MKPITVEILESEFQYTRYASGLVIEGRNLLYFLLILCSFLFGLKWIIFWPILGNFYQEDFPVNIVKGKICTMTRLEVTESNRKDLSIKPKLLLVTACLLFGFAVIAAYRSSLRNSKCFTIPKKRRNLLRGE